MTRYGVMKHLKVLEDAGLVIARRSGREKLHFLNPVPIRLIHDRWIDKYTRAPRRGAHRPQVRPGGAVMTEHETTGTDAGDRDDADPPRLHQGHAGADLAGDHRPGVERPVRLLARRPSTSCGRAAPTGPSPRQEMKQASAAMGWDIPEVIVDGEVLEADPPRRLVQTWRMAMDPTAKAEGFSRLTWEIEGPGQDGVCRLTVTHELAGMPSLFAMTSGQQRVRRHGRWRLAVDPQRPEDACWRPARRSPRAEPRPTRPGSPDGVLAHRRC